MSNNILVPTSEPATPQDRRRGEPTRWTLVLVGMVLIAAWSLWPGSDTEQPADVLPVPEPFSPPVGDWIEATFPDVDGGFTAIAEHGGRLAAVGTGLRVDSPPFAYVSTDGSNWTSADGPWEDGDVIVDVAGHAEGFMAVGHGFDVATRRGTGVRLWTSADGEVWERLAPVGFGDEAAVTKIAFAGDRFLAIGYDGEPPIDPGFVRDRASPGRVWTSVDGQVWSSDTPAGVRAEFRSLIATAAGEFVIGGLSDERPTIWRSGDDWSANSNPLAEYRDFGITALVDRGADLVAMSQLDPPESPVVIWSVDEGGAWTGLVGETGKPQSTRWIAEVGGDLYAGPPFSRAVFTTGPEMWVSDRGTDWFGVEVTRGVSPWPPAAVSTVIERDGRLLALGSRGGSPSVWTLQSG